MPTLRENLRALPRPVWILFGGTFINRFGTFVMPFLAIYLTRRGYGDGRVDHLAYRPDDDGHMRIHIPMLSAAIALGRGAVGRMRRGG
ncbi:MAG: hypothetical protein DMF56_15660 [Acidobacteria bacterium]|nr:MAG: hypothetical protein DMF56_15660 [Acidobacteriota bacterium]